MHKHTARVVTVLTIASLLACRSGPPPVSSDEQAKVRALVEEENAKAASLDSERRAGLIRALAELVPRPDLGPCPIQPRMPSRAESRGGGFDIDRMTQELEHAKRIDLDFVSPEKLGEVSGPLVRSFAALTRATPATRLEETKAVVSRAKWDWDLVIVEEKRVDATKNGEDLGSAGEFRGTALLWSFPEKKVACMGRVDLRQTGVRYEVVHVNGREVSDSFELSAGVQLSFLVLDRAVKGLSVAGPPVR